MKSLGGMKATTWTDPMSVLRHVDPGPNFGPAVLADAVNKAFPEPMRTFTPLVPGRYIRCSLPQFTLVFGNLHTFCTEFSQVSRAGHDTTMAAKGKCGLVSPTCYWYHQLFVCGGPTAAILEACWYCRDTKTSAGVWRKEALAANLNNTGTIKSGWRIRGQTVCKTCCVCESGSKVVWYYSRVKHYRGTHQWHMHGIVPWTGTGPLCHLILKRHLILLIVGYV